MTEQTDLRPITHYAIEDLKPGVRLACNGYAGTVSRLLSWSDGMVEVTLKAGVVCVSKSELVQFQNQWAA